MDWIGLLRITPALTGVIYFLTGSDIWPPPARGAAGLRLIGCLFPALWLSGVGPEGLLREGGFLMRLLGLRRTPQNVVLVGLVWLTFGLSCGGLLYVVDNSGYAAQLLYACAYVGLMAALGVFVFFAAYRPRK